MVFQNLFSIPLALLSSGNQRNSQALGRLGPKGRGASSQPHVFPPKLWRLGSCFRSKNHPGKVGPSLMSPSMDPSVLLEKRTHRTLRRSRLTQPPTRSHTGSGPLRSLMSLRARRTGLTAPSVGWRRPYWCRSPAPPGSDCSRTVPRLETRGVSRRGVAFWVVPEVTTRGVGIRPSLGFNGEIWAEPT